MMRAAHLLVEYSEHRMKKILQFPGILRAFSTTTFILAFVALSARADGLAQGYSKDKVEPSVSLKAWAFPLQEVRLLDGPFKHAMDLDGAYLLALDTDRLVHNFRVNAGLPSTAQPLGGWEAPKGELRGHFVGHYLSACALMYASTGDKRLKEK